MKFFQQKKNIFTARLKRGFTLIETLVAISILMIAVVVPLTIVAGALQSSYYASDQITAVYLAQDAMEYVRNIRDTNAISIVNGGTPASWLAGLESCFNQTCQIDTVGAQVYNGTPVTLDYNSGSFQYVQNATAGSSRFTRTVFIKTGLGGGSGISGNANEAQVTVTVTWTGTGTFGVKTFTDSENIYNAWQ